MSFVTILYAALFYFAATILFVGLAYRVYEYAKIPAPLKIPTPPAPMTQRGVAIRIFREVVFFRKSFFCDKMDMAFQLDISFSAFTCGFEAP
jgi:nitrate reductase gamma subunit